jgi:hypothetical protein
MCDGLKRFNGLKRFAMKGSVQWVALLAMASAAAPALAAHNIILFVPDGLRAAMVDVTMTPTFSRLRDEGVNFVNSHSLFPTFTTANASAFATGHQLGDTGDFSNFIYSGVPVQSSAGTVTPFLEADPVLREMNARFGGNYLNETMIVAAAQAQGLSTALIGKVGPVGIFDLTALDGAGTLIVDDSTGQTGGVPLSKDWLDAIKAAKLKSEAPSRGDNGNAGDSRHPGTWVADYAQQQYFLEITTKVVLPRFKAAGKPFVLIYWSRDPDGTQHNQGDSLGSLTPGINGPTSIAAIRAADSALAQIEQALKYYDLADSTDIVVAADHGFSTISKQSATSPAAKSQFADTVADELPVGFLAIDLTAALQRDDPMVRLFDPDASNSGVDWSGGAHPAKGNGLIGHSPEAPQAIIAANGGTDLIYIPSNLPARQVKRLGVQLVRALLEQDYVSGVFVDRRRFGEVPGTLSLGDIGLEGRAVTPIPAIAVNFRSFSTGCDTAELCAAEVADTRLQQGQGMHGSFSRADTWNFMAARGPDFRAKYVDQLPVSNADIGMTLAHLLKLELSPQGSLVGRVLDEALSPQGPAEVPLPAVSRRTLESRPAFNGLKTVLKTQQVGSSIYFDAAGFPARTVGIE